MADKHLKLDATAELPRRRFIKDAVTTVALTCVAPATLSGCQLGLNSTISTSANADTMEQALEMMNGLPALGNHGPMAAEALIALGRPDAVESFIESYKKRFRSSSPAAHQKITRDNWREALGDGERVTDWTDFFNRELQESAWTKALEKWSAILAPGLAAAAAHGVIRTAHAARSLSAKETERRRRELAEGLGYWAAYYQPLPDAPDARQEKFRPAQALAQVPMLPTDKRKGGSVMNGLRGLTDFQPFSKTARLVEIPDKPEQFLSELTETFATAYLQHVNQRSLITLIHAVTGTAALRSLLPYLSPMAKQQMARYGWQAAAALYAISASASPNPLPDSKEIRRENLIEQAVASQEEHAIKFTEACLREYSLNPKLVYLQAAQDAVKRLT